MKAQTLIALFLALACVGVLVFHTTSAGGRGIAADNTNDASAQAAAGLLPSARDHLRPMRLLEIHREQVHSSPSAPSASASSPSSTTTEAEAQSRATSASATITSASGTSGTSVSDTRASATTAPMTATASATALKQATERKLLLVAVISGGDTEDMKERRSAVLSTWAAGSDSVFFVTKEEVATPYVVRLPEAFEQGGRFSLPNKVLYMWHEIHRLHGSQYNWFMKADDDTYVHMPQLGRLLSKLDPSVPIVLGRNAGAAPYHSQPWLKATLLTRKAATFFMFCHGGSGYIWSKGLLDLVGERLLRECGNHPRHLWEDMKMRLCIKKLTDGIGCTRGQLVGFDIFSNVKDQDANWNVATQLLDSSIERFMMQVTFHSVYSPLAHKLHFTFSNLEKNASLVESAHSNTAAILRGNAWNFVSQWVFKYTVGVVPTPTEDSPFATNSTLRFAGYRMQNSIRQDVMGALDKRRLEPLEFYSLTWQINGRAPSLTHEDMESESRGPLSGASVNSVFPDPVIVANASAPPAPDLRGIFGRGTQRDVILAHAKRGSAIFADHESLVAAVQVLVHSVRHAGCLADIAVFLPESAPSLTAKQIAIPGTSLGIARGILIVRMRKPLPGIEEEEQWLGAAASFLSAHKAVYDRSLVTSLDTVFQMDPFALLPQDANGVALFLTQRTSGVLPSLGVCGRPKSWTRDMIVMTSLSMGAINDHIEHLLALINARANIGRMCNLFAMLQRLVWEKTLSRSIPVTVYSQDDGPFASWEVLNGFMTPNATIATFDLKNQPFEDNVLLNDITAGKSRLVSLVVNAKKQPVAFIHGYSSLASAKVSEEGVVQLSFRTFAPEASRISDISSETDGSLDPQEVEEDEDDDGAELPQMNHPGDPEGHDGPTDDDAHGFEESISKPRHASFAEKGDSGGFGGGAESKELHLEPVGHRENESGDRKDISESAHKNSGLFQRRRLLAGAPDATEGRALRQTPGMQVMDSAKWPKTELAAMLVQRFLNKSDRARSDIFETLHAKMTAADNLAAEMDAADASPVIHIANPKTHKTGSSTLASILYRFGARHGLRMFRPGKHVRTGLPPGTIEIYSRDEHAGIADIEFHHLAAMGRWEGDYENVDRWYKKLISPDVSIVTVFREPVQQYLSHAYFYVIPQHPNLDALKVLEEQVAARRNSNPLCADFGIYNEKDAVAFMGLLETYFHLVLISERFDEGLILMRRLFHWKTEDITYLRLLDSHAGGVVRRWDGKILQPTPKVSQLPAALVSKIRDITRLDKLLYDKAVEIFDRKVAEFGREQLQRELQAYKNVQSELSIACSRNAGQPVCRWYALEDSEFFPMINSKGYSQPMRF